MPSRGINVPLDEMALKALCDEAAGEWRPPRAHAAMLIIKALRASGALPPDGSPDDIYRVRQPEEPQT